MEFTPAFYQITCSLPGDELSVADTDDKVLDLMKLTIQSDTEDMADDLGTIFYSDGTGNGSKDPLGMAALVDDGITVASIGGLARSTYTTLASTVTDSGGALTFAKLDTLHAAVSSGSQKPSVHYTTETASNLFGQLLRPQERIYKPVGRTKEMIGGTGFMGLEYSGKPILADEKCTAGAFIMANEQYLEFRGLPFHNTKPVNYKNQIEGNDYDSPLGLGFSWTDWIIPDNAGVVVGHIYFGGQFITTNPKRHGKLTSINSI
jgi:hypothetical protein